MRVAIFGSNGFIGSHLSSYLQHQGHDIITYSSKNPFWLNPESGDLKEEFYLEENIDYVYFYANHLYINKQTSIFRMFIK